MTKNWSLNNNGNRIGGIYKKEEILNVYKRWKC